MLREVKKFPPNSVKLIDVKITDITLLETIVGWLATYEVEHGLQFIESDFVTIHVLKKDRGYAHLILTRQLNRFDRVSLLSIYKRYCSNKN